MVDDDETKDLITWTGAGDQFTVFNNVDFSRTVLPRYFKHCNWSSFVRQLNMYDFHKINEQNDDDNFNNRLIPQMRYSNAMELVDDGPEVASEGTPSTSAPSPYTPSQTAVASSSAPAPMKADSVQYLVTQLHDTTKNFESKLDYTCNEILYLRSVVDSQQMVLNELYNSVEYLKSRQIQKETDGNYSSASSSNQMDGEEARKPRKIHELLGINHDAQRMPQLQQQQPQRQEPFARREGSRYAHPSPNHREENDSEDYNEPDDYDDRSHGRRKRRSQIEK
ncbi:HSF-type DNA-binding-domain-containing protein [Mucor lusitanicus]